MTTVRSFGQLGEMNSCDVAAEPFFFTVNLVANQSPANHATPRKQLDRTTELDASRSRSAHHLTTAIICISKTRILLGAVI